MRLFLSSIIILILGATTLCAQAVESGEQDTRKVKYRKLKIGKKKKLAKRMDKKGSYINAAQYYEEVYAKKPSKQVAWKLGDLNRILRDYVRAEKYYGIVVEKYESSYPMSRFLYANMLKMNGKYDQAKKEFTTFASNYKDGGMYADWAKREAEGCDLAMAMKDMESRNSIKDISSPPNRKIQEYAPKYIDANTMMYSSLPTDSAVNIDSLKFYRTKIFTVTRSGNSWGTPEMLKGEINSSKFHNVNAVINKAGNTMYYTQCNDDAHKTLNCDIVVSSKNSDGTWGDPKSAGLNVKGATTTQPAIGIDKDGNEVLYFVSNRVGTMGGLDIFYANIDKNGNLSGAKNLGKTINTVGDEMTPFYDAKNEKFYFSSNGHKNIGGLDIFWIKGNIDNWDTITNLGTPINSQADDIYLALDPEGINGYIVSNRVGSLSPRGATCCDDIYSVVIPPKIIKLYLSAICVEKGDASKKPLTGVNVNLFNGANKDGNWVSTSEYYLTEIAKDGKFKLTADKVGYYPAVNTFNAPEIMTKNDTIQQIIYLEKIKRPVVQVENVYFVFDKSFVRNEYAVKMDSLISILNAHPDWAVQVSGHTDSKGTDEYNDKLSQRRAKEAADYLVSKGIDKKRIMPKGFGETKHIAPNEFPDGRDNPVGRSKNRRVEFKIITDGTSDIEIIYDEGAPLSTE